MENTAGMEGTVRGLYVFRERGQPGEPAERALFQKDKGMEGDRHATGGKRQVTLLSGEVREWINAQPQPGLCFRRYKANLETEGLLYHADGSEGELIQAVRELNESLP